MADMQFPLIFLSPSPLSSFPWPMLLYRWPQQWYLNRGDRLDMNVQDAWAEGATGKGVSITILDDGIERSHPDLMANYDPQVNS